MFSVEKVKRWGILHVIVACIFIFYTGIPTITHGMFIEPLLPVSFVEGIFGNETYSHQDFQVFLLYPFIYIALVFYLAAFFYFWLGLKMTNHPKYIEAIEKTYAERKALRDNALQSGTLSVTHWWQDKTQWILLVVSAFLLYLIYKNISYGLSVDLSFGAIGLVAITLLLSIVLAIILPYTLFLRRRLEFPTQQENSVAGTLSSVERESFSDILVRRLRKFSPFFLILVIFVTIFMPLLLMKSAEMQKQKYFEQLRQSEMEDEM